MHKIKMNKIPDNKLLIIPISEGSNRKQFHLYLEKHYPNIYKTSLKCSYFPSGDIIMRFTECYECDFKRVNLNQYRRGYMKNNKDEYRYGECPKCGEKNYFECNYDDYDDLTFIYSNNIIAIGTYFKGYNKPSYVKIDFNDLDDSIDLNNINIYEIDAPDIVISKRKLQSYISDKFENNDYKTYKC